MEIIVFNRQNIQNFATDRPYVVISVRDSGSLPATLRPCNMRKGALFLEFDDVDKMFPGMVTFNLSHAHLIWAFVEKWSHQVDVIAVNCEAGISRSAGVAGAISRVLNGEDKKFFMPPYYPNRHVYSTLLNLYMNGGIK